ncbi:MAG TPA: GNAT family N-acetyltransferase [Acidimicrobiia bacterium]|nr:GNAT family N-acetyltransferase [Acidimicrobiia bacterium]
MGGAAMWMMCFAGDARIEGDDAETIANRFVAHAKESHDWPYSEEAIRNYARNYAEANVRLTGDTKRLSDIGEVTVHPVTEDRLDDWIRFFDDDAFAGNPDWASCYCLEPHVAATGENPERPWREVRAAMVDRLRTGGAHGYLAYVDGNTAGWVNASPRSDYGMYREVDPDGPDPASVIGVSCFIIAPPYRRHGLAARLLDKVIADAADRGAQWVEGYPYHDPKGDDAGHYRGSKHIYDARGFELVKQREHDTVMRRAAVID